MGVKDYEVFGRVRFGKEEQFTHLRLIIEAFSESDALEKVKKISDKVYWSYCKEYICDDYSAEI